MKYCICVSRVCLVILFASAISLAQEVSASSTAQAAQVVSQVCPTISVSCPSDIDVGKQIEFSVSISGPDPDANRTYTWEVVGGVIAEGQGTHAIRVKNVGRQSLTATLHVGGLDSACANTVSCTTPIHLPFPPSTKFDSIDSYDFPEINKEQARLDLFAAALKQHPGAQAYILGYGGRRSPAGEVQKAVGHARGYLVDVLGIDQRRIVTVDGGFKEQLTVDLWLVPAGSNPPAAEPTLDPTEVKLIKPSANKRLKRPTRH